MKARPGSHSRRTLEDLLRDSWPVENNADLSAFLKRAEEIDAIIKRLKAIGTIWKNREVVSSQWRPSLPARIESIREPLSRVEAELCAFDPSGTGRKGRRPSAVLNLWLKCEEQRREVFPSGLKEIIGSTNEGPVYRGVGEISPELLKKFESERQRSPIPSETQDDLQFFNEVRLLASQHETEMDDQTAFLLELFELWHQTRKLRSVLDSANRVRSERVGRPEEIHRLNFAIDALVLLRPIHIRPGREWKFVESALATVGFRIPKDHRAFIRRVREGVKIRMAREPRDAWPLPERRTTRERTSSQLREWTHPEGVRTRRVEDPLLRKALREEVSPKRATTSASKRR